jgi:hypothetical protein
MEVCKPMATPMVSNLKVTTLDLELVDPMLHMQLIGSLMNLVNTKLDMFSSEYLESVHDEAKAGALGSNKTCA